MKIKIPTCEVAEFEEMWNALDVIPFFQLTREIDFVNETTTITIPEEFAGYLPAK